MCYENTSNNQPTSTSEYSHHCALSFNHAATWQEQRILAQTINDYEGLASDFSLHHDGFFTAFSTHMSGKRYVVGKHIDLN